MIFYAIKNHYPSYTEKTKHSIKNTQQSAFFKCIPLQTSDLQGDSLIAQLLSLVHAIELKTYAIPS